MHPHHNFFMLQIFHHNSFIDNIKGIGKAKKIKNFCVHVNFIIVLIFSMSIEYIGINEGDS